MKAYLLVSNTLSVSFQAGHFSKSPRKFSSAFPTISCQLGISWCKVQNNSTKHHTPVHKSQKNFSLQKHLNGLHSSPLPIWTLVELQWGTLCSCSKQETNSSFRAAGLSDMCWLEYIGTSCHRKRMAEICSRAVPVEFSLQLSAHLQKCEGKQSALVSLDPVWLLLSLGLGRVTFKRAAKDQTRPVSKWWKTYEKQLTTASTFASNCMRHKKLPELDSVVLTSTAMPLVLLKLSIGPSLWPFKR